MSGRPNILLILTDQHSPHISGFAGNPVVNTDNLDRLAENSTRFDAAYCQSPLCVPSRMSLWTGKTAARSSAWDNRSVIFPEHRTLPSWLAQHGYTTAAAGKMHFRGPEQLYGFQYRPYGDLVESRLQFHQPDPPETADGRWSNHAVGRFPFAGPTAIPESLLADNVVSTESLAWLLEFTDTNPSTPWFFVASYSRPHFPLTAPGRYIRKYLASSLQPSPLPAGYPDELHPHDRFIVDDFNLLHFSPEEHRQALAAYYACVDFVDDCIGRLLDGLRKAGCLDNTYVVYTSDHGDMAGEHGLWWKRTYYEASARIPLLVAGPDVPTGATSNVPVELVDLFPTFCDWAGTPSPPGLDGESLVPLLSDQPDRRHKKIARSVLLGEKETTQFRMVRDQRWKMVDFPNAPFRLFDLSNDPAETSDLAGSPPSEAPIAELEALLNADGSWTELAEKRTADRERAGTFNRIGEGCAQYRLADGRLVEADAQLYRHPGLIVSQ